MDDLLRIRGARIDELTRKEQQELRFWIERAKVEGVLNNQHYQYFFTTHFGLAPSFFRDKSLLDVGCGPRGSLDWATEAACRIGLDPLVDHYRCLGISAHAMSYVSSIAERMPFLDVSFDIVSFFNALDNVDDLDATIAEIKRVLAVGGTFLLLTDVHAEPTVQEPQTFTWEVLEKFTPEMQVIRSIRYERSPQGLYQSLVNNQLFDDMNPTKRWGVLSALLCKPTLNRFWDSHGSFL